VALFPHDLALRIRRLNDQFIQAHQTLGIKITSPSDGSVLPTGTCKIRGTFINRPGPDVIAMTYVEPVETLGFDGGWWPQDQVMAVPGTDNQWEVTVQFGVALPHRVCIVKANDLGRELVKFYDRLKEVRRHVILRVANLYGDDHEHVRLSIAPGYWPLPMSGRSLPKGLDPQASVRIDVVNPGTA